jgi:tetratricopeptide (TPR) repeat protein
LTVKYKPLGVIVTLMARRRLVTVEEAVLLHLLGHRRYFQEDTVPLELCQAGISHAIGVRRSHVASALDSAKERGLVEERLVHIRGLARRRKGYALSGRGMDAANDVRGRVLDTPLKVWIGDEVRETTLGTLQEERPEQGMAWRALNCVDRELRLPIESVVALDRKGVPVCEGFVGRGAELERVKRFFEASGKVLGICGMAGIGKTTMATEIVNMEEGRPSFWCNVEEWSSPRNAFNHLAVTLKGLDHQRLSRYIQAREMPDLGDVRDILVDEECGLTMVFDDCQNASPGVESMLKVLASACLEGDGLRLIMLGRALPDLVGMGTKVKGAVLALTLEGLDRESGMELLRARGITGERASELLERSGGHPLFLTLVAPDTADVDGVEITSMICSKVFDSLKERDIALLSRICVFREPVVTDAVALDRVDVELLESLSRSSVLTYDGRWHMHSLLKEWLYGRLGREEREDRHLAAAEFYGSYSSGSRGGVEEVYHLLMAGESESAIALMASMGEDWLGRGFQDELLQLCALLPRDIQSRAEGFDLLILQAKALKQVGEWDEAQRLLRSCLDFAKGIEGVEHEGRALQVLGAIQYRKGDLDGARDSFEKALSLVSDGAPEVLAEVQNGLGVVQWRLGDAISARQAYLEDLRISTGNGSQMGQARALNNIGILDWQEGKVNDALERYRRALDLAESIPDMRLVAILHSNIADAYRSKGRYSEAQRCYERCLELSEDLRFRWQIAEACRGLADLVPEKRDEYLNRALEMFDGLGAKEDAKAVRAMMG